MPVGTIHSAQAHLAELAGWLYALAEQGGCKDIGASTDLVAPAGRWRLYTLIYGPDRSMSTADRVISLQHDDDPIVAALLGSSRRSKFVDASKFAAHIFDMVKLLQAAEVTLAQGLEADTWGIVAEAKEMRGMIRGLLNVARMEGGPKLVSQVTRRGADAANAAHYDSPRGRAKQWARAEYVKVADKGKSWFAEQCLAIDRSTGRTKLQEMFGEKANVTKKHITDRWLDGL